ncbi:MAG: hypothetical protein RLZZ453_700 [Chlamydiota bacterium]|jgi:hypothetical protein
MSKLNILKEEAWDRSAREAAKSHPLKELTSLPKMPGITEDTAKGLQWKAIKYLLFSDPDRIFPRYFFKHPFSYASRFIRSFFSKPYAREQDFFFYGVKNEQEFIDLFHKKDAVLALGFSYCHKPFECPSGRFSDQCAQSSSHPVCRQCFIGKTLHLLPKTSTLIFPLFIPTIHYIGEELFKLREKYPSHKLLFLITACEMTLEMFSHWGHMIQAKGIGVRLDGRICNTMAAFELSEKGIKPGLTVVLPSTQRKLLSLIQRFSEKA